MDQFIKDYNGKYVWLLDDPSLGNAQCVALFWKFNSLHENEPYSAVGAVDLWSLDWGTYTKIPTSKAAVAGDWCIWAGDHGAYQNYIPSLGRGVGHVARFVSDNGNGTGQFFSQNPGPARVITLSYDGIIGYLRPILTKEVASVTYEYITKYNFPAFTAGLSCPAIFGHRRTVEVDIIHWWNDPSYGPTFMGTISHFLRQPRNGVSAHYVVEAGRVACGINEGHASHANGNSWANAKSVTWECNPLCRDGDYDTLAEALADAWIGRGYSSPGTIAGHNSYTATACPGDYDLGRVRREAAAWFRRKKSGDTIVHTDKVIPIEEVEDMATPEENWDHRMKANRPDAPNLQARTYQIRTYENSEQLIQELRALLATQGEMVKTIAALAKGEPFDPDELLSNVYKATAEGVTAALLEAQKREQEQAGGA